MVFYLSKVAGFFLQPTTILLAGLAAGALLLGTRHAVRARRLIIGATSGLVIAAFTPLAHWLTLPLEERFPRPDLASLGTIEGIIVLGGSIDTVVTRARRTPTLTEAGERMTEAVALARRLPAARLVFSGGSAQIIYESMSEADVARMYFEQAGVPSGRIVFEDRSRTTFENAQEVARVLAGNGKGRWLLVTSAFHMPRAMGCFRAAGIDVVAWPVDFRTRGEADRWRFFNVPSDGLRRLDLIAREWVGLVAYRVMGRIPAMLPAP